MPTERRRNRGRGTFLERLEIASNSLRDKKYLEVSGFGKKKKELKYR